MKKHFYDYTVLKNAPDYVRDDYSKQGYEGAACGYVRKNTTITAEEVTCKRCLRAMKI